MKSYPSIPYGQTCDFPVWGFDKLDGSNIRGEWSSKKGWYKFGSRNKLLTSESGFLNEAPEIILGKYGYSLAETFRSKHYESVVAYFEFFGKSSFAGQHVEEQHDAVLIDVDVYKRGILDPDEFIRVFGELDTPRVVHTGPVTEETIESIRSGMLQGVTFEGVVFKGKRGKKFGMLPVFKQKSRAWLDKLTEFCGDNTGLFRALK